jgi:hypothetical protein
MEEVRSPHTFSLSIKAPCLLRWAAGSLATFVACLTMGLAAGGAGRIAVQTVPAGATVYVDGQPSGKSPAAVEGLAPGRYFVRVELDGFRAAELVVELAAGQRYQSPAIELVSSSAPAPRLSETTVAPASPGLPAPVSKTPSTPVSPPAAIAAIAARATPAPVAPPAPVTAPETAPAAPSAEGGSSEETAVKSTVNDYLTAIADGNIGAYVELCAPSVEFYEDGTKTPAAIRKVRQQFKDRWPVYEIENVRDLSVKAADRPGTKRASVTYDWKVSNPKTGKKASGTATDQLDFREIKGKWLIVRARQVVDRGRR